MINLAAVKENRKEYQSSTVVLVAANLLPLLGVLLWGWSTFSVVVLYWLENLMVGFINILKMIVCNPDPKQVDLSKTFRQQLEKRRQHPMSPEDELKIEAATQYLDGKGGQLGVMNHASKLFIIPFFTFHYGMFCFVHGAFVFLLLGNEGRSGFGSGPGPNLDNLPEMIRTGVDGGTLWAALALLGSHLFSFFVNYLGKGEYRRTAAPLLMFAPYGRIVVLHVAILFGAFVIMWLGSPVVLLVLLIAGKTCLDLGLHVWSHTKLATREPE